MFAMSASRASAWVFCAAVLGAWLASAAGRPARTVDAPQRPAEPNPVDHLAADVQAQAGRLRQRLDAAPAPQTPLRNPFVFSARSQAAARPPREVPAPVFIPPAPIEPVEPSLMLVGIAEKKAGDTVVRTAMIAGDVEDLMMVTAGQRILGIYDVVAIGFDAVELKHVATGATRRLALR